MQVERDLALLTTLARRFERHQPGSIAFRPSEAVAELAQYTRRELDFRREARTAERLRQLFAGDDRIVIPAVISDRSSARVLTTEFLQGLPPGPAVDLRRAGLDPAAVLRAGAEAMLRQVFQFGLVHPGRVRSLILGCTAASAEGVSRGALLTRARSLLPAAALNRMAWKLLYGPGTPAGRRAEDQQIVRRTRCTGRGRRGQLTGAAGFDVTGRLAEIGVRTLVLHGARDRIVPAASARRLAGGIAGARLVVFPDAGHVYVTDAANQQVLHFLAGMSGPADGPGTGARPATSTADT